MSNEFHEIKYLHQIFIVDDFVLPRSFSPTIQHHIDVARSLYPQAAYKMWSGNEIREFIKRHFSKDVLKAFDTLTPYAYKSDLARYCLMYIYGGLYFDLSMYMLNRWQIPRQCGVAAFYETYDGMECWASLQNSLLWSLPKRKEWKVLIEKIVSNCRNRYYGPHDHYVTGSPLLGRSFATVISENSNMLDIDDQYIGEVRYITPERFVQNVTFVSPDRRVVALRNKSVAGNISELGVKGANSYCLLWKQKKVFGEKNYEWLASDQHIIPIGNKKIKKENGVIYVSHARGRVFFGPYVDLPAGSYKITLNFLPNTKYGRIFLDIATENTIYREYDFDYGFVSEHDKEVFFFNFDSNKKSVEFRMSAFGDFFGGVTGIVIEDNSNYVWDARHPTLRLADGGKKDENSILVTKKDLGKILYGPHVDLEAGFYRLNIKFIEGTVFKNLKIAVTAAFAQETIENFETRYPTEAERSNETYDFFLSKRKEFVEFVLYVDGDFQGGISQLSLEKVKAAPEEKYEKNSKFSFLKFRTNLFRFSD